MTDKIDRAKERREAFGLDNDPLEQFETRFRNLETDGHPDALEEYIDNIQRGATDNEDGTIYNYELTFRDWREHMAEMDRHPACPNKDHVLAFIDDELAQGSKPSTVKKKVDRIENAYKWWQKDGDWPHRTDFNPFGAAKELRHLKDTAEEHKKKIPPKVPLDDIREVVDGINHILDKAIVGCQLKFGCRSGELANIRISDIHIDHPGLLEHYPQLGSNEMLSDYPNAVFIPHNRKGNKRKRSTVLPLDEEARRLLIDWLLVRPDTNNPDDPDDPHLFMTHKGRPLAVNDIGYIWGKHWWPEYKFGEDDQYRSVSPHFGRHRFSTYWKSDLTGINREWVKYMRGDKTDRKLRDSDALDHYIHSYYEDVEELYRNQMYQLYV